MEFLIIFLAIVSLFAILITHLDYGFINSKANAIFYKVDQQYCKISNSLNYNYFEINKGCSVFKKEDVYAGQKYG
jgi:hypothetical protein